jgi:hypothetical protein
MGELSFGYEAEFETGVEALCQELHRMGYTRQDQLCSYHCSCSYCEFPALGSTRRNSIFRLQTDSSCDGEVISRPFLDGDLFLESIQALQIAATEADAEAGPHAGFHVHVDARDFGLEEKARRCWEAKRWEQVLIDLAAGKDHTQRQMNHRMMRFGISGNSIRGCLDISRSVLIDNYRIHEGADRHSNLNINTRFGTWEWRFWNATRSAWRMELYCRVSCAMMEEPLVERLSASEVDGQKFAELVSCVDTRCAELIERQQAYAHRLTAA